MIYRVFKNFKMDGKYIMNLSYYTVLYTNEKNTYKIAKNY